MSVAQGYQYPRPQVPSCPATQAITPLQHSLPAPQTDFTSLDTESNQKSKAGRKSTVQAQEDERMIQHTMQLFFGVGQSLPLKPFCSARGFETDYQKIRRRVINNPTLKSIQDAQSMTVGFTVHQSTSALNIILAVLSASPKDPSPMGCVTDIGCNPDMKSARKSPVPLKGDLVTAI